MNHRIRILLVDDHAIVRNGLKLILESDNEIKVCGEANSIQEALLLGEQIHPDVILLDLKLPDNSGIDGFCKIKKHFPYAKVIILTAYADHYVVIEHIKAGVDGYILKNIGFEELLYSIKKVYTGLSVLDPSVTGSVIKSMSSLNKGLHETDLLSIREIKILEMISQGKMNKEIASVLKISEKTVRNYISHIFKKINVSNRTEAAGYWMKNGH